MYIYRATAATATTTTATTNATMYSAFYHPSTPINGQISYRALTCSGQPRCPASYIGTSTMRDDLPCWASRPSNTNLLQTSGLDEPVRLYAWALRLRTGHEERSVSDAAGFWTSSALTPDLVLPSSTTLPWYYICTYYVHSIYTVCMYSVHTAYMLYNTYPGTYAT